MQHAGTSGVGFDLKFRKSIHMSIRNRLHPCGGCGSAPPLLPRNFSKEPHTNAGENSGEVVLGEVLGQPREPFRTLT